MMEAMEPLLYAASVDIVLAGHVHAYERTVWYRIFWGGDIGIPPKLFVLWPSTLEYKVSNLHHLMFLAVKFSDRESYP